VRITLGHDMVDAVVQSSVEEFVSWSGAMRRRQGRCSQFSCHRRLHGYVQEAMTQCGAGRRRPRIWSRYRGVNTQNSFPSGSAMTTQLTSPWPISMRVAPRETRRSTSTC